MFHIEQVTAAIKRILSFKDSEMYDKQFVAMGPVSFPERVRDFMQSSLADDASDDTVPTGQKLSEMLDILFGKVSCCSPMKDFNYWCNVISSKGGTIFPDDSLLFLNVKGCSLTQLLKGLRNQHRIVRFEIENHCLDEIMHKEDLQTLLLSNPVLTSLTLKGGTLGDGCMNILKLHSFSQLCFYHYECEDEDLQVLCEGPFAQDLTSLNLTGSTISEFLPLTNLRRLTTLKMTLKGVLKCLKDIVQVVSVCPIENLEIYGVYEFFDFTYDWLDDDGRATICQEMQELAKLVDTEDTADNTKDLLSFSDFGGFEDPMIFVNFYGNILLRKMKKDRGEYPVSIVFDMWDDTEVEFS